MRFKCNICGLENDDPDAVIHRELLFCQGCGSTPRFRGLIHAFQKYVSNDLSAPLSQMSRIDGIRGIGMSDWLGYSLHLERIVEYRNTFYHQDPYLDVTDAHSASQYQDLDFVISSDVLEHVHQPVIESFRNIRNMLKPGGWFVLSVPYLEGYESIEHYPHLNDYKIVELSGVYVLVNRRVDGLVELYDRPVFHGGDGSVLELRVFGEGDLLSLLKKAGFSEIHDLEPRIEEIGYVWSENVESEIARGRKSKSHVLVCKRS